MHYHTALVNLFRPLVGLEQFHQSGPVSPESISLQSATEGLHLLEQYRMVYTCRYQSQLQILCLVHLCDFLVRFGSPKQAQDASTFCLHSLKESRTGFAVCGPLQELFRRTLVECGVPMPPDLTDLMSPVTDFCLDDIMDACTRLSYMQPVDMVRRRLQPSVAHDWEKETMKMNASSPSSSNSSGWRRDENEKLMQIRSILNR